MCVCSVGAKVKLDEIKNAPSSRFHPKAMLFINEDCPSQKKNGDLCR